MDTCAYGQHFQGQSNPPAVCQSRRPRVRVPGGRMDFKNTVSDSEQCDQHSTWCSTLFAVGGRSDRGLTSSSPTGAQ
jgi:hypothetical protein